MENDRELRAVHQYQTRHVAPCEDGDDRPDRAVNLVVMKILKTPREDVFRGLPEQSGDDGARHRVAQRDATARHETIDERKECDGNDDARQRKDELPEGAADQRQPLQPLRHKHRKLFGKLLEGDENRGEEDGDDEQQTDEADHAERNRAPVQKRARACAPDAIDRALDDGENPRACPERHDDATDNDARPDIFQRAHGRAQEFTRTRIDLDNPRQHLAARRHPVAQREQREQRGKERQQPEITHRGGGREQIIFVKLVERVAENCRPRREISHAPRVP